jgi:S-adenosylmethionine:tRNA ribosyltransferase-isomerase
LRLDDLDYPLPDDLIAQTPAADRAASRLLHYRRSDRSIAHRMFRDLPSLLRAGDLLVLNNARVTPAKFTLIKPTGGRVEGLFVEQRDPVRWTVMLKNLGPVCDDAWLGFERDPATRVRVVAKHDAGLYEIEPEQATEPAHALLERVGRMPLPPYIRRDKGSDEHDVEDHERYQTVYARMPGSIASPTAGLHFTPDVFAELDRVGVQRTHVTLHVGLGTFKPVEVEHLDAHVMHFERYALSEETCAAINAAKRDKRRVIVVGTTSTRVLESQPPGELQPVAGQTNLFIKPPGYTWKHVDALITNFHQPRSTLVALVMAFMGVDEQRRAYAEAVERRYRFLSYGDSMFVE